MGLYELSDQIKFEYDMISGVNRTDIQYWLANHIGYLNNLINTCFVVNSGTLDFDEDICPEAESILKKLYLVNYFQNQLDIQSDNAENDISEITTNGATVRITSKNELIDSIFELKQNKYNELKNEIRSFKLSLVKPHQVTQVETEENCPI